MSLGIAPRKPLTATNNWLDLASPFMLKHLNLELPHAILVVTRFPVRARVHTRLPHNLQENRSKYYRTFTLTLPAQPHIMGLIQFDPVVPPRHAAALLHFLPFAHTQPISRDKIAHPFGVARALDPGPSDIVLVRI